MGIFIAPRKAILADDNQCTYIYLEVWIEDRAGDTTYTASDA